MKTMLVTGLLLFWSGLLLAETPATEVPPPAISGEDELEPEVNIIKRDRETIEEYRIQGRLYMIKVTPNRGIPYYLIDSDGDGSLDSRRDHELQPEMMIPQWVLFRW